MSLRSYGDALAALSTAMLEVHEQTCSIEAPHRWERCTSTPTIFGVADGLDAEAQDLEHVALRMHDRECELTACGPTGHRTEHAVAWHEQAAALLRWTAAQQENPLPPVAGIRGDLMVMCACGCVRRNHSVDGKRCFRHGLCTFTPAK